jgi:ribosome maturation factor RimP
MQIKHDLQKMLKPVIEDLGFEIVRIALMGEKDKTLQIMIERKDREVITVDDCADASYAVSAILDVEDPIKENYSLEVSSPGIDRPLVKLENFERFVGFVAKIETKRLVNDRKRFKGTITSVEGENIKIDVDGTEFEIPHSTISKAKLVLTDELLAACQN